MDFDSLLSEVREIGAIESMAPIFSNHQPIDVCFAESRNGRLMTEMGSIAARRLSEHSIPKPTYLNGETCCHKYEIWW